MNLFIERQLEFLDLARQGVAPPAQQACGFKAAAAGGLDGPPDEDALQARTGRGGRAKEHRGPPP